MCRLPVVSSNSRALIEQPVCVLATDAAQSEPKIAFRARSSGAKQVVLYVGLTAVFTVIRSHKHLHNLILGDKYTPNPLIGMLNSFRLRPNNIHPYSTSTPNRSGL
jgi:hypothetical protein